MDLLKLANELDGVVCTYLVYLAHIKSSLSIPPSDKAIYLDRAKVIGTEMNAAAQRIKSMEINAFNRLEANKVFSTAIQTTDASVKTEIRKIEKIIQIDKKSYFSLKQTIEVLANGRIGEISFTKDKIDRLLSFRHIYDKSTTEKLDLSPEQIEEQRRALSQKAKEIDALEKKKLLDIKYRNFKNYCRNRNNKNDDAFFKIVVLANELLAIDQVPLVTQGEHVQGLYFIDVPGECIALGFKKGEVHSELSISILKIDEHFRLSVQGFIDDKASKAPISIEETFSASNYDTVINSFNIKRIIEAYDCEYTKRLVTEEVEVEGDSALRSLDALFDKELSSE